MYRPPCPFREPKDAAALVYEQTAAIVWNSTLVTSAIARELGSIPNGLRRGGAQKEEAKSLLRKSLEHPILSTIIGGAIDLIKPN
jgi:hypothetical protein